MSAVASTPLPRQDGRPVALRTVTTLIATVVALSFLFGLGNVWALGIRLGVPAYIAPLVAPAVDLSVIALLVATRQLALAGASPAQIQPAQRLLIFCSVVTLALNTAEPILEGHYGRAAFDAVGCCLLIGWSHIGPALLQALQTTSAAEDSPQSQSTATASAADQLNSAAPDHQVPNPRTPADIKESRQQKRASEQDLLHRARAEDTLHWESHHRPISAETLRKRLHIGADTARNLVTQLRTDTRTQLDTGTRGQTSKNVVNDS